MEFPSVNAASDRGRRGQHVDSIVRRFRIVRIAKQGIKEIDVHIEWEKRRSDLASDDLRIVAIRSYAERSSLPTPAKTNLVVADRC